MTDEVGFTDQQRMKLSEHRDKMTRLTDDLHRSLALLRKLKKAVDENQVRRVRVGCRAIFRLPFGSRLTNTHLLRECSLLSLSKFRPL